MKTFRLLVAAPFLACACQSSAPPGPGTPPPVAAPPPAAPAPAGPAPAPAQPVPAVAAPKVSGVAADEKWAERLRKAVEVKDVGRQQNEAMAEQYYQQARGYEKELAFDKAEDSVTRALELNPGHPEARELRDRIALARGHGRPGGQGEEFHHLIEEVSVQVQEAQQSLDVHINKATQLFNEAQELSAGSKGATGPADVDSALKKLDDADKELRHALELINWFPHHVDLESRQKQASHLLDKVKEFRRDEEVRVEVNRRRLVREQTEREEQRRRQDLGRRLDLLFEQAKLAFENERFQDCIDLCEKILYMNPNLKEVFELERVARRADHAKQQHDNLEGYVEQWKRVFESIDRKAVLQGDIVVFPDRDTWERIKAREPKGIANLEDPLSPAEEKIVAALQQIKVTLEFQDQPLAEVVDFLREFTRLNFFIDQDANPADVKVTLRVQNLPLQSALNLILGSRDLAYLVEDEVIKIIPKAKQQQRVKLELYDVQDLTARITDFPGPDISLVPQTGTTTTEATEPTSIIPSDSLVNLIKSNIAKDTWEQAGNSLDYNNGLLIVRNSAAVHRKVQQFLRDVRGSTGLLVTVQTRFLRVQDNFLEEIGVDFKDLDTAVAPLMNDVNFPIRNAVATGRVPFGPQVGGLGPLPIPAGDEVTTGVFAPLGTWGTDVTRSLAARAEHIIDQDTLVQRFYATVFSNSGGFSMQYTLLDDVSLEAILRAVKKQERSVDISAPELTLFNTQRAHLLFSNQLAYVRDYDVELATAAALPDPQVDIVQDGVVLDVRPIVSADRRFITLELRPTVARLIPSPSLLSPMNPNVTTPVGPVSVTIETPVLRIERVRTTVTMPDRGTILLGGFTDYVEEDSIAEIPILSQIPLLSFFTSRKMKGRRRYQLLILTRAQITLMEEEEARKFR